MKDNIETIEAIYLSWIQSNTKKNIISTKRAYPTAIIASKILDFDKEINAIESFGKSTLWLFGLDILFDERNTDISLLNKEVYKIINPAMGNNLSEDNSETELNDLKISLYNLFNSFSKFDNYNQIEILLKNSLYELIYLGMIQIYKYKSSKEKITYNEYIKYAQESIGVKFVNLSVLTSMDFQLNNIDYPIIEELNNLSSKIIRLKNDLVTYKKELEEGNINSLLIVNNNINKSKDIVEEKINIYRSKLDEKIDQSPKYLQRYTNYVQRLVNVTLSFYDKSDFYDSKDKLKANQK